MALRGRCWLLRDLIKEKEQDKKSIQAQLVEILLDLQQKNYGSAETKASLLYNRLLKDAIFLGKDYTGSKECYNQTKTHWDVAKVKDRPIICVDFDHCITTKCPYCEGGDAGNTPQKGVREALQILIKDFRVWIFSGNPELLENNLIDNPYGRIKLFLDNHKIPYDKIVIDKPPCIFIIDDRAIHHLNWTNTLNEIVARLGVRDGQA